MSDFHDTPNRQICRILCKKSPTLAAQMRYSDRVRFGDLDMCGVLRTEAPRVFAQGRVLSKQWLNLSTPHCQIAHARVTPRRKRSRGFPTSGAVRSQSDNRVNAFEVGRRSQRNSVLFDPASHAPPDGNKGDTQTPRKRDIQSRGPRGLRLDSSTRAGMQRYTTSRPTRPGCSQVAVGRGIGLPRPHHNRSGLSDIGYMDIASPGITPGQAGFMCKK